VFLLGFFIHILSSPTSPLPLIHLHHCPHSSMASTLHQQWNSNLSITAGKQPYIIREYKASPWIKVRITGSLGATAFSSTTPSIVNGAVIRYHPIHLLTKC